jgi:LPXTG-site transpeptidase (sortase) family protein
VAVVLLLAAALTLATGPAGRQLRRAWEHRTAAAAWQERLAGTRPAMPDDPVARLSIPAVALDTWVLEGASEARLHRFPCRQSVGRATLITAHRDLHFRPLRGLAAGHDIELEDDDGSRRRYRVLEILVLTPARAEALIADQRATERLILVTCHPFVHLGPAPDRCVVLAARQPGA